jgi:hypothetical protein
MSEVLHVIRFGLIKCEITLHSTSSGDRYNVRLVRLYRNGDQWHESTRFGRDDLQLVAKLADMAHTWIYDRGQSRNGEKPGMEARHGH